MNTSLKRAAAPVGDLAIVGLGRIGSTYDAPQPGPIPRSHIGAALATGAFNVTWLIDADSSARDRAREQWPHLKDARFAAGLAEIEPRSIDVVALCTPPERRAEEIPIALTRARRVVVVEKPLGYDAAAAARLAKAAEQSGIEVRVNFQRRFDPGHVRFKKRIPGVPRKAVIRYGKGLFNYGSHAVDLLIDWFGPVSAVQALDRVTGADPNLSFRCRMAAGFDVYVIGIDGVAYDQFELDVLFEDARIELANGGVERHFQRGTADKYYPGYRQLDTVEEATEIATIGGLREFYDAMAIHLAQGAPLGGCTAYDAAMGLSVLETALRSCDKGGLELLVPDVTTAIE